MGQPCDRVKRNPSRGRAGDDPLLAARQLWQKKHFDEALRAFSKAVRRAPHDARLLIEASRAYGFRYQIDRSLSLLEKARRCGARQYAIAHAAGETYRMLGRLEQAETCFRRACQLAKHPRSQLELAAICERRHRLDEADELAQQALKEQPDLGPAVILRARIARRRGEADLADTLLRTVTSKSGLSNSVVAEAWGEMATLLDEHGQYDAAWDAAVRCKTLLLPLSDAEWQVATFVLERCRRMMEVITADHFGRWASFDKLGEPRRLALLTGFPRSGTTLLERVLDAHPQIVTTEEKDLFATVVFPQLGGNDPADTPIEQLLDRLTADRIQACGDFYYRAVEAMCDHQLESRLHVDKNPSMTLMIPAMRRLFPELTTIVALRDPRDVVLSCYLRYLPLNPVSVCFLTLERTVERYLLDLGAWAKLRNIMPSGWIEVRYEDTVRDVEQVSRSVLAALELPWRGEVLNYLESLRQRPVLSPTYEAVAKPIFSTAIGRWRHYEQQLAPVLHRLTPMLRILGYDD